MAINLNVISQSIQLPGDNSSVSSNQRRAVAQPTAADEAPISTQFVNLSPEASSTINVAPADPLAVLDAQRAPETSGLETFSRQIDNLSQRRDDLQNQQQALQRDNQQIERQIRSLENQERSLDQRIERLKQQQELGQLIDLSI